MPMIEAFGKVSTVYIITVINVENKHNLSNEKIKLLNRMICALFAAKHIAKSLPIAFRPHFIGNRKIYFFTGRPSEPDFSDYSPILDDSVTTVPSRRSRIDKIGYAEI